MIITKKVHQNFAETPKTGQRSVPIRHHFQRTLLTEENVHPLAGNESHEPECAD
jgi:hypothetical protein